MENINEILKNKIVLNKLKHYVRLFNYKDKNHLLEMVKDEIKNDYWNKDLQKLIKWNKFLFWDTVIELIDNNFELIN